MKKKYFLNANIVDPQNSIEEIGGLIIGIAQHDLPVSTAAENYIILSVGDGLVAQIPSLLLAIATLSLIHI